MTDQRELDRLLGAYFVDGTDELADRVIDAALDQIDHTHQRRPLRVPRRFPTMTMPIRLAAAAVIGVLVLGGAFYSVQTAAQPVGRPARPSPTASAPPCPSPGARPASMADGTDDFAATLLADGRVLVGRRRNRRRPLASAELYDPATGRGRAPAPCRGSRLPDRDSSSPTARCSWPAVPTSTSVPTSPSSSTRRPARGRPPGR